MDRLDSRTSTDLGTGLYVDVENLQQGAQSVVMSLLESWPTSAPGVTHLHLYVKADQTLLWEMWATSQFPTLTINVVGIQHFSTMSKNSADIAMAMDAITDLLLSRIEFIVTISDDSDFIALYNKVREEVRKRKSTYDGVPFLWVATDREGTRSTTLRDFFPNDRIHVVRYPAKETTPQEITSVEAEPWDAMTQTIIEEIPIGVF